MAVSSPLNFRLMSEPANWVIIGLMLLFAILAFNLVSDYFNRKG